MGRDWAGFARTREASQPADGLGARPSAFAALARFAPISATLLEAAVSKATPATARGAGSGARQRRRWRDIKKVSFVCLSALRGRSLQSQ